jgi:hypothetical protein
MTGRRLTYEQLRQGAAAALASGRFRYRQYSARVQCTYCGRSGWPTGWWAEACLLGHPYVCACGRVFATRQGLASHRRYRPANHSGQ